MRIGEALRKERLAQGKTQSKWIKGINISVSHYSEIESGYTRNGKRSDINSEDLIRLLKYNNVNIADFFEIVSTSYEVDEKTEKLEKYMRELRIAFNDSNLEKVRLLKNKLVSIPSIPKSIYYQAVLFEADLTDHMMSLDEKIKQKIDRYIYQSSDWVTDTSALIIFGDSMPILDKQVLITRMGQVLRKYTKINNFSTTVKIRISTICINYLYNAIFVKQIDKYIFESLKLIKKLPADDIFGLKKIIAKYFEDVLNNDLTHIKELKLILKRSGLEVIAAKL